MRKQLFIHSICLVFGFLVLMPSLSLGTGDDLQDRADSLRYILGLHVDGRTNVELSGANITEFSLYNKSNSSAIVWTHDKEFYVYSISGTNHTQDATQLLNLIKTQGLDTFVAKREPIRRRLDKYHSVLAIKIKTKTAPKS